MANDIDLDKLYTHAAYQFTSATLTTYNMALFDKLYTHAAYQYTSLTTYNMALFDKLYTHAVYQYSLVAGTLFDKAAIDKLCVHAVYARIPPPNETVGDPYFGQVGLIMSGTNIAGQPGTPGSTAIVDEGINARPLTSTAQVTASTTKYDNRTAAAFNGTSNNITAADDPDWNLGSALFTIEGWFSFNNNTTDQCLISHFDASTSKREWALIYRGASATDVLEFLYSTNGSATTSLVTSAWTPTIGQWYYIVAERAASNVFRIYVDGVQLLNTTLPTLYASATTNLRIGNLNG